MRSTNYSHEGTNDSQIDRDACGKVGVVPVVHAQNLTKCETASHSFPRPLAYSAHPDLPLRLADTAHVPSPVPLPPLFLRLLLCSCPVWANRRSIPDSTDAAIMLVVGNHDHPSVRSCIAPCVTCHGGKEA